MKRLVCLLLLGAALAMAGLWPALAKVAGVPETVAVVSPPVSSVSTSRNGCTPLNPCALPTPALSEATLPQPESPPQPQSNAGAMAPAPASPAQGARQPAPGAAANATPANCLPRGRGDFAAGRGRGEFAGRAGQGRGEFAGRFGQGRGQGDGQRGRGEAGRGGRQGGQQFARAGGPDGCPPAGTGRGAPGPAATNR